MASLLNYLTCQTACITGTTAYFTTTGQPIPISMASLEVLTSNLPSFASNHEILRNCMTTCATTFLYQGAIETIQTNSILCPVQAFFMAGKIAIVSAVSAVGVAGTQSAISAPSLAAVGYPTASLFLPLLGAAALIGVGCAAVSFRFLQTKYANIWEARDAPSRSGSSTTTTAKQQQKLHLCPVDLRLKIRTTTTIPEHVSRKRRYLDLMGREGTLVKIQKGEVVMKLDAASSSQQCTSWIKEEVSLPYEMVEPVIDLDTSMAQALAVREWNKDDSKRFYMGVY